MVVIGRKKCSTNATEFRCTRCNGTKDNYKSLSLLGCAEYDEIDIDYSKVLVSK